MRSLLCQVSLLKPKDQGFGRCAIRSRLLQEEIRTLHEVTSTGGGTARYEHII